MLLNSFDGLKQRLSGLLTAGFNVILNTSCCSQCTVFHRKSEACLGVGDMAKIYHFLKVKSQSQFYHNSVLNWFFLDQFSHFRGLIYKTSTKTPTKSLRAPKSRHLRAHKKILIYKTIRTLTCSQFPLYKSESTWEFALKDPPHSPPTTRPHSTLHGQC